MRTRPPHLVGLLAALAMLLPAAPGLADHASDSGALSTRWVRHGFREGWEVRAADVDGDGSQEILYGGRKIGILDEETLKTGLPRRAFRWSHEPTDQVDGGDNVWVTGMAMADGSLYVTSSDTDAYVLDPRTGAKQWHNPRTGSGLSEGFALVDAPGDSVPDLFPTGGTAAFSGSNGAELWQADLPRPTKFAVTAEVDGTAGRDAIVATNPSGVAIGQDTVFAVKGNGAIVGRFSPNSVVESLAAGDLDGDGIDEMIVGTGTGWLYAVGANGALRWVAFPGPGRVKPVAAVDVDGDGTDEVVAGYRTPTEDDVGHHVVAYDDGGVPLWRHPIGMPISVVQPVQLDEDASLEVIAGGGTHLNLDTRGVAVALDTGATDVVRERWRVTTHQEVMSATMFEQDGRRLALLGSADAILRAVDPATGAEVWRYSAGGYVFSVAAGDVNGDGADEVAKSGDDGVLVLSDATGRERWSRRADVGNNGLVRGLTAGDIDGDGGAEFALAGTRFAEDLAGVVEVYGGDGTRRWSTLVAGSSEDVEIADLNGDGEAEVIAGEAAGLDAECSVSAFDGSSGTLLWRRPVSGCLVPVIDVGDVDGDGTPEIAYGDRTLASQPHLALLEADGTIAWKMGITDQVFWIEAISDGIVHGGFTFGQAGAITRRTPDGAERWKTTLPDDDDWGSASRFATMFPDGNGGFSIAASADDGAVSLLSGADGAIAWRQRLEPLDLRFQDRHPAGPIVHLPSDGERPARLIVGQYHTARRRAGAFALTLGGQIVGSAPMEGQAQAAVPLRFGDGTRGAAIGAGLALYVFDACAQGCPGGS